jgi:phosphoribosylamine--glycine ligase
MQQIISAGSGGKEMAKVMILGSGGREAAVDWWFRRYGHSSFVAPGNADSQRRGNAMALDIRDFDSVARAYFDGGFDLVFVGPEAPLVQGNGIVDVLSAEGVRIFGPRKAAAMLEGSKIFARDKGADFSIPQPDYAVFDSDDFDANVEEAIGEMRRRAEMGDTSLHVVKSDHLAGGKGVTICNNDKEVIDAIRAVGKYGPAFLLEEKLVGTEASAIIMADRNGNYVSFPFARDYKHRFDGNYGPMTGGMGTYAPSEVITSDLASRIGAEVFRPMLDGMRAEGTPVEGVLYAGLMIVDGNPYVLEFNVRFGDPETQSQLPLVDADPYLLMMAAMEGNIHAARFSHSGRHAVTVVAADREYPTGSCAKGNDIRFGESVGNLHDVHLFHAGTKLVGDKVVVNGGRVMCITAVADTREDAHKRAYKAVEEVFFQGMDCRSDIGR